MHTDIPPPQPLPASYRHAFAGFARALCRLGMSDEELAREFRIARATLCEWLEIPEFAQAVWEGRRLGDGNVADGLYRRAVGASHEAVRIFLPAGQTEPVYAPFTRHYPPETPAAKYWLKNRRPQDWRDKVEIEAVQSHDQALGGQRRHRAA